MTPDELKETRSRLGLTQTQLAQELGVTLNAVQRWEAGERPIRRVTELALETLERRRRGKRKAAA